MDEEGKPDPSWKRVRYRSVHHKLDGWNIGWLKPNGDVVGWWDLMYPPGWLVYSSKNEVAAILEYL